MFHPIDGGSVVDVQGLPCNLPPVGYIYDYTGDGKPKLKKIGVFKRHPYYSECYWQRDERWDKYLDWVKIEKERKKTNPDFRHTDLKEFIEDMWRYRIGGFWFYNNETPTYITGQHWFYLSCYHLDTGLPDYRDADREFFYAWQYVQGDPNSFGLTFITKRRSGKTYMASCIAIELTTRSENFNSGIQSKTDDDAKAVFRKGIISPYRKLPFFFRPSKSNMEITGKSPAHELRFYDNKSDGSEEELASQIDYKPSLEGAYDGQKLGYYFADEVGKPQTCSINDRWDVVQFCLKDHNGNIIGKTIHTTTVEDMDGSSDEFFKMWTGSDQTNKKEDKTVTGMYQFFVAGDRVRCLDRYGIPNRDLAVQQILKERKAKESDPRALAAIIRKDPLSIKEAFQSDSDSCVFNPVILNEREDFLKWMPKPMYVRGNFHWVNDIEDGDVEFRENENGRFKVAYLPPEGMRNAVTVRNNKFMPNNNATFAAGVDPYDHKVVSKGHEKRMSNGAMVILKKPNPVAESMVDGGPACIYVGRPMPEVMYEDIIKCLKYYGCEALIETNKPGLLYHMEKRGYEHFCAQLPDKSARGISSSAQSNIFIGELTDTFINQKIETVFFQELIADWKRFDPANTTEFDIAMAFGFALILVQRTAKRFTPTPDRKISDYFSFMKPRV